MKKAFAIVIAASLLLLCLAGCKVSGNTTINSTESSGDGYWRMTYESFDGNMERWISLSGADEYTFSVDIVTDSGSLALSVTNSEGETMYSGIQSGAFSFMADEEGDYVISFEADKHSGSFSIEWE